MRWKSLNSVCVSKVGSRSVGDMDEKLIGMTRQMEELQLTSKTLETLPGMEDSIKKVEERIRNLSEDISGLTRNLSMSQTILREVESSSAHVIEVIRTDGEVTRESLRRFAGSVNEEFHQIHERQMQNESAIKTGTEILLTSPDLAWYEETHLTRPLKVWFLDQDSEEIVPLPQATLSGLDLTAVRLDCTYQDLHTSTKRHIADSVEEDLREMKRQRVSTVSPYVALARRGDRLDELREFVPSKLEERFTTELSAEAQTEGLRAARSLSQEYRYLLLDKILRQKADTIPKIRILEDLERAMLALHTSKMEAKLGFVVRHVVDHIDFPYNLFLQFAR